MAEPRAETLTVEDAGRILGISRAAAWRAVWRGEVPSIRIGRRVLVPRARLDALLRGELAPGRGGRSRAH